MQIEDFETLLRHGLRMPNFTLRTINSTFFTEHYATDLPDADVALQQVVRGAIMIAADEAYAGRRASAVEAIVENEAGVRVRRAAVTVSVAPLAVGEVEQQRSPEALNDR